MRFPYDAGRGLALAVAAGRLGLGAVALARPRMPARAWLGKVAAHDPAVPVLARALGGRDLVLGAGAAWALLRRESLSAPAWVAAGVLADLTDACVTAAAGGIPKQNRGKVLALAGGSAVVGAVAAGRLAAQPHGRRAVLSALSMVS